MANAQGQKCEDECMNTDLETIEMGELATKMGIKYTEFTAAHAVATMPVEGNRQAFGILHGGASVALGETMGSMCAVLHAGEGANAVGVDINATHTRAIKSGTVTGVCTAIHLGRKMTVHEIVISDEQGRRISTVRITNVILPKQ